jgi:hypothetical protein
MARRGGIDSSLGTRRPRLPPKAAPGPTGVRARRRWSAARRRTFRLYKRVRERFARGHAGVEKAPHWRRTWKKTLAEVVVALGALFLIVFVGRALYVLVVSGKPLEFPFGFNPDGGCADTSYSCGITSGILMTFLSLAFATAVFFIWRLGRIRRLYARRAREETKELLETAGTIISHVVGRDKLCNFIMDDLKDRRERRPHVILGGVGVGKTAARGCGAGDMRCLSLRPRPANARCSRFRGEPDRG